MYEMMKGNCAIDSLLSFFNNKINPIYQWLVTSNVIIKVYKKVFFLLSANGEKC